MYAAIDDGYIIFIVKEIPHKGNKNISGYLTRAVKYKQERQKSYQVHRFVWECFNGDIPDGKVIDRIGNNTTNNRLTNLQLLTPSGNCKKSAKSRDYSLAAKNHENKKCVKVTNYSTNEVIYFTIVCTLFSNILVPTLVL